MDLKWYANMVELRQFKFASISRPLIILVTALAVVRLQSVSAAIAPSQAALAWLLLGAVLTVALAAAALVIRVQRMRARARTLLFGLAIGIVLGALFRVAFDPLFATSGTIKASIFVGCTAALCCHCCIVLARAERQFQTLLGKETAQELSKTG